MLNIKDDIESRVLNKYGEHIMQLYKALNRQYSKKNAINVIINFIYKKFNYRTMYLDIVEDNKKIILKDLRYKYSDGNNPKSNSNFGICSPNLPMDEYKKVIYLEDDDSMMEAFPHLKEVFQPKALLFTPVFLQNELIGALIIYDIYERKIFPEFKDLTQLIARELTAVFCRIERQNLAFENMLKLTAMEDILLYSTEDNLSNINNPLQKIVSALPNATGMERCVLALIDEDGKFMLSQCFGTDTNFTMEAKKYFLGKIKNRDHTGIIALETKQPVIVYDALTDPRCDPEFSKELGIYSNITLPILNIHGKPLGIIYLDNGEYENFSKGQIRFLKVIARHIGLIISNMEYIGDLKIWSKYDGLTDLLNRRTFENIYKELYDVYRFSGEKFSILMVDIDDFKSTNDIYGHQIGDKVLKSVAKCIKQNVREKDIVARYGGEEVIIILKDIGKAKAKIIANRIRHSISALSVNDVSVTVSIGVSTFGVDSYNKENLIYIADKCLYEAKSIGKNQVVCK